MLLLCAVLTLPFMIPVSIPGVSTVFGLAILSIGVGVTLNRVPWLPGRVLDRPLSTVSLRNAFEKSAGIVSRLERLVRPRWSWLTRTPTARFAHGLSLVLSALLLMLPFGLVPFSNTLPALAALLLALGLIERDGVSIAAGYVMNVVTIVYFGSLVAGAIAAGQGAWSLMR
ncbi:MAG TPA: exopolysaccharide biosynthesis protein, partial [Vicinamibacteria bacterium]